MTERIYYEDVYCRGFSATVLECAQARGGFQIRLDRTAFYPEGGGQPADHGVLCVSSPDGLTVNETSICDVQEAEGEIWHLASEAITPGTMVQGRIDWERRFDLMQNHSGEHIVSGLIHQKYGYENVGFHMGSDLLTVDLSGEFSYEEMLEIEFLANRVVWANAPIDIRVYREEDIKDLEYRSKKELHGQVRIVTIPGADVCACCGTHVSRTGEVGLIKLISLQRFRGGVRMEMLCGARALQYVNDICEQNHRISVALSAKPGETASSVLRLKETAAAENFRAVALENELFAARAKALSGRGDVFLFEKDLVPDSVRKLAVAVMEQCGGRCAVFSGTDSDGYKYALGEPEGDLRDLVKEMNLALSGRGGGKPFFAQGSVAAQRSQIELFLNEKGFCGNTEV